ncbi:hypothetical protein [Shewanella phage FishSpeaker]|nr:hypothetical protein [Shewanella phage FishSpeaker]
MKNERKNKPDSKGKTLADTISKYVKDEDLLDTPARLFRALQNRMKMNPIMWAKLLREYLEHSIVMRDKEKEKKARAHQAGNYKTVFFNNNTLTWNKLLEGVSILQAKKCKFTMQVTMMDDTVIEVSEECIIKNCKNSGDPVELDDLDIK